MMADIPTPREIELEILVRERDRELAELSDEISRLRQFLSTQPGPSTTEAITLPPPLVSLIVPHILAGSTGGHGESSSTASGSGISATTGLMHRVRLLQEENDELYELLKRGETGRLKEEVRGLGRVVERLEGALGESHQVILNLSTELDKSYEVFLASRQNNTAHGHSHSHSHSPPLPRHGHGHASRHGPASSTTGVNANGASPKVPPTGPRAHKKPRLSESNSYPQGHGYQNQQEGQKMRSPALSNVSISTTGGNYHRGKKSRVKEEEGREREMDVDGGRSPVAERHRDRGREKERERERPRVKERDRERERDMDRERDRERERERAVPRRNGVFGRRGGMGRSGDRTLAERMGL